MPTQPTVLASSSTAEQFADAALFLTVTIPIIFLLATMPFCSGWNEGSMAGTCHPAFLAGIYNTENAILLLLAFGGFLFVAPIVLTAALVGGIAKIRKYLKGYRLRTLWSIAHEVAGIIPFLVIFYLLYFAAVTV